VTRPKPERRHVAPRKRLRAADRRAVILERAKALFASRGYSSTSLDDVAAAAGVTKPVVYDHFQSKRELCVTLMQNLRDELIASATEALSATSRPQERFHAAIANFFRQVERDPAIVALLFVQLRTEPELSREWQRLQAEAIASLKPLAEALAPGLEPWKLNVALHFLHHGLNATAAAWPRDASADEMTELVVSLLWKGLKSVR
jgi:AcrR family transcriptional regulator